MKKLFNILRHFTSRWSKSAKGGGLGLITLALAVVLFPITSGGYDWVETTYGFYRASLNSAPIPTPTPTTILTDTFTAADDTLLTDHTPDEHRGAGYWTSINYFKITGNELVSLDATTNGKYYPCFLLEYTGTVTYKFMAGITNADPSSYSGIAIRSGGPVVANYIQTRIGTSAGQFRVSVYKYTSGTYTSTYGEVLVSGTHSAMRPVKVVDTGSNIKMYFDTSGTEATTLRVDVDTTDYNTQKYIAPVFGTINSTYPRLDTLIVQ